MIGVGVIGYGYWGPNMVRNFSEIAEARVVAVCERDAERRALVERRYPSVRTTADRSELLADPDIDAVVIATPVDSHFPLALEALQAGKHVLVEKPMTESAEQGERLIDEAARRNLVLLVDHTFIYTGAVQKTRELVESGVLGDIYYYDSTRINLGLFQHDVDVIWDLATHDLSILDHVLDARPVAVSATGTSHVPGSPENVAYITVYFDGNTIAHVNVNWLSPVKLRRTLIGGTKKMVVYDDLEPSEKIKVYDTGITLTDDPRQIYNMLVGYRTGDMWAPKLNGTEALRAEAGHFVDCVLGRAKPITGGDMGLRVVRLAEAATASMKRQGEPVSLDPMP